MRTSIKIKISGILIFLTCALLLVQASAAAVIPSSSQFDITGFLQEATLDQAGLAGDPHAGGTLKVNGHFVVVPKDTIVILSANALTWQELFTQAPAPYGLITAAGVPETGMAMKDIPQPLATYEVEVIGNYINTSTASLYIAGLIYINQEGLNSGSGYINYINYTVAEMRVGGRIGDPNTGTRVRINDPPRADLGGKGRYSRGQSPDPRFTVDQDNPTISSITGYPMGIPDTATDPNLGGADDPLRPLKNRPTDPLTGAFLTTFTMPAVAAVTGTSPDPRLQMPFEVGDFITFSGTLVHDGLNATVMPATGYPNNTYISAIAIVDNVAVYTAPGDDPAYVTLGVFILEAGGTPVIGVAEAGKRSRFEGFTTDPTRNIHLFGIDVNATGATTDRDYGSIDVDCGPLPPVGPSTCTPKISGNGAKGRFRFRPPSSILTGPGELAPPGSKANKLAMLTAFLPPVREVRAALSTGEAQSCSVNASTGLTMCNLNYTLAPQPIAANGIKADQYHAPILEYIFPENIPGQPMIPNNLETFSFLFNGGYTSSQGTVGGEINPFPIVYQPTGPVPAYVPALNSVFVVLKNATIGVNGTEQLNALPLDQRFVPFPGAAVSFTSGNPAVATVNATTGLVTGVFPGTALVTATAVSGITTVTGTATITVTAPIDTYNLTVQSPPGAIAATNVSSISLARGTSGNVLLSVMSAAPGSYVVNVTAFSNSSVVTMTVTGPSANTTGVNAIATYLLNVTNTGIIPAIPTISSASITTTTTVIGVYPSIAMLLPLETRQFNSTDPAVTWTSSNLTVGNISATGLFTASSVGNTTITATNATGIFGTALVIVGPTRYTTPPLAAGYNLIIVPVQSDPAFNASRLLQLVTAQNPGVSGSKAVRWNATSQLFETYDPFAGLIDFPINASQGYFVNMTANATNISIVGTLTGITQPPPVVRSINVTPANVTLVAGANQTFTATALDQLGNPTPVTVLWSSNNTIVGTINATTGLFTANATGITLVNATNGTVNGSALVTVIPPAVTTINVAPASAVLVPGLNMTFTATTLDQLGRPINATLIWNSSNPAVGTINASTGVFAALVSGTTIVNATNGTVNGSASVTVIAPPPAVVTTITVAPATATLVVGANKTFTATALDQLGNPTPVTVTWSSNNTIVGTINATTGVFIANATGIALVNATNGTVNGSALVTVTAAPPSVLTTINIVPATATLVPGVNQTFTATTLDQLGNNIVAAVTWSSSNPVVGTINATTGVFTPLAAGITTVNASNGSIVGNASVTVTAQAPVLATINVTPASAPLVVGGNQTFTATTLDQFGNPINATLTWISSNTTVGTINATTGVFTANAPGNALVVAINGSVAGTASVAVSPAPVANGTIAGNVTNSTGAPIAGATVTAGSVTAITGAAGNYSISLAPGIYTVTASAAGFVTQSIPGVSVTSGATATQNFALVPVPPANGTIAGNVTNSTGAPIAGATVTAGSVTAITGTAGNYSISIAPGTYTVTASAAGFVTNSTPGVSVTSGATTNQNFILSPQVLTAITVSPATASVLNTTGTQVFNATALDQFGALMSGIPISWSISNPAVNGTVTPAGALTDQFGNATTIFNASTPGNTFVNATSAANASLVGSANVTVI